MAKVVTLTLPRGQLAQAESFLHAKRCRMERAATRTWTTSPPSHHPIARLTDTSRTGHRRSHPQRRNGTRQTLPSTAAATSKVRETDPEGDKQAAEKSRKQ